MFDLLKPILGEVTALTLTSRDLEKSLMYYQQLGFNEVMRMDFPFPWFQITDGTLLIMLRFEKDPYIALTYYVNNIDEVVADLEEKGIQFRMKPKESDIVKRYLFTSPDSLNISLVFTPDSGFTQPVGPTMLKMKQEDYFKPEKYPNSVCGMFGELAHPIIDLDLSINFWQKLGFTAISKFTSPYPWAIISDGLAVVGLHQTKTFSYPAITYFASDMKSRIDKLRSAGFPGLEDSDGKGSVTLITPEQQHINLFSMGM